MKKILFTGFVLLALLQFAACNNGGLEENPCKGCPNASRDYGVNHGDTGTMMMEIVPIGGGTSAYIPVRYTVDTLARPLDTLNDCTFDGN